MGESENKSINQNNIQWFPGHMMKALHLIEREIKNVDMTITILDARAPLSSLNPEVDGIVKSKPVLYILNKRDLADSAVTPLWEKYFIKEGAKALPLDSKNTKNTKSVHNAISSLCDGLLSRRREKGITGKKINIMTVGVPNAGKSTFINLLAGSRVTRTEDRPGVTRGKQIINTDKYTLVDMPGVLPRKFKDRKTAANRAFIGSVRDDILDIEEIVCSLLDEIKYNYPGKLCERYKLESRDLMVESYEILETIGKKRGMLLSGGVVNTERAAQMVLDEFRGNKLGGITLERPV